VNLGSAVAYRALAAGEIDAYVDYSGTLWANVLNRTDNPGRQAVLDGLRTELKTRDGVVLLGRWASRTPTPWPCAATAPSAGHRQASPTWPPGRRN
jgi:hypothetical protein